MKKINIQDWQLHFTRFRCPLIAAVVQGGWSRFIFPVENIIVNSSKVYFNDEQFQDCVRLFSKKIKNEPQYLLNLVKQAYREFNTKKHNLLKLETTDFKKFNNEELVATFSEWFEWLYQWNATYIAPPNLAEDFFILQLEQEIGKYVDPVNNFQRFQELQLLFTTSARPGFLEQYESNLRALAKQGAKIKKNKLSALEHEYGWLGDAGRLDSFWDANEIKKQILSQKDTSEQQKKDNLIKKALADIKADSKFKKFVTLVREYVYFRTFRMDVNLVFCYRARFLLKEISQRLYIPLNSLTYISSYEIVLGLQKGKLPEDLNQRRNDFTIILQAKDIKILGGKQAKELAETFKGTEKILTNELHGTTACVGQVKGIVKLVFTSVDISKVAEGDVLVSPMTKPEFVVAMKKAAAFVTDEGGITCHAAIVSRELNKPCIIGTKIATKVFKDGDVVEVDANNGIVRKI